MTSKRKLKNRVGNLEGKNSGERMDTDVYIRGLDGVWRKDGEPVDEEEVKGTDEEITISIGHAPGGENDK